MSDSSTARAWRFYLEDMIRFAEAVLAYTDGLDQEGFVASRHNDDVPPLLEDLKRFVARLAAKSAPT